MTEAAVKHCRSCGDPIVWLRAASGKLIPVNADTWEEGDETYEHGKHVSHFATCPQASEWRKK